MDKKFLTYLGNKLKTGNLASIHLSALPGRLATRLDLCQLDSISGFDGKNKIFDTERTKISEDFLFNHLLSKARFQFKINFDQVPFKTLDNRVKKSFEIISRKLNAMVNQDQDSYLEHGIKTFSFGYPLLVKRSLKEPGKIIKAPVVIWNLDIRRSNSLANEWVLSMDEDSPVYINEVLISHLNNEENIHIGEISNDFLEDNLLDKQEIIQIINNILEKLNTGQQISDIGIAPCPTKEEIEAGIKMNAEIAWCGIFGLFKTQKQSIIKDTDYLLENFDTFDFQYSQPVVERKSTNTSVQTDPSQEAIIATLDRKEFKLVQGPPGTGKSQSLTAIITNTLENGKKILVVCEKKTALDVIYNNLQSLELDKLCAIIDDVARDRKRIIDLVRSIAEAEDVPLEFFNETEYDRKLNNYDELINDFNRKHHNLLQELFNGYSLQELIAEYLHLKNSGFKDDRLLQELNFGFSGEEYHLIKQEIEKAMELFEEIPVEAMVFDIIGNENFKPAYTFSLEEQLFERIKAEIEFLQDIDNGFFDPNRILLEKLPEDLLTGYNHDIIEEQSLKVQALLTYWQNFSGVVGKIYHHFLNNKLLIENDLKKKLNELYSLNDNMVNLLNELNQISDYFQMISEAWENLPAGKGARVFSFGSSGKLLGVFSARQKSVNAFRKLLSENIQKINQALVESAINNTNSNLQEIISRFMPLGPDVEELLSNLRLCANGSKWFAEYYRWRQFLLQISPLAFQSIRKLNRFVEVKDWPSVFSLNYINLFIESKANGPDDYNLNAKTLDRIALLQRELKALQKQKILKLWEEKSKASLEAFNQQNNIKLLFNHRKNNQYAKKNTLRSILQEEFDLFTDVFPVMLVNPVVCSSILPLRQNLFEIVLFDEASQLRLEDTYPALLRGKIKVISGDKHQMPPSNYFASDISLEPEIEEEEETTGRTTFDKANPLYLAESESLLEFGNSLNPNHIDISYLDYHYRSKHPYLIDFSNVAFYGGRLVPMPEKVPYKAIRFMQVDGVYQKDNTNPDEGRKIIEYLKTEYPINSDGSYPSLGIATFNLQQRNLIKDMINEECINNEGFRLKMELVGKMDPWFVKNLENIQGDERDIIIISTTFGKNAEGSFRQNFGPVNSAKGYKLLNVIITRAKSELLVFTSIPKEYYTKGYQDEIQANGNKGKAILYAYLDYCRAVEESNEDYRQGILKLLQEACDEETGIKSGKITLKSFEKEVEALLRPCFKPESFISKFRLGGYLLDFVLLNDKNQPIIAIECDGAGWHKTPLACYHDLHRKKTFESQGLRYFRIWSKNWWPDPAKEIEKLIDFVRILDESVLADK